MPKIMANVRGSVDTLTITVDSRFVPPEIQMKMSRPIDSRLVVKLLATCILTLSDLMIPAPAVIENETPEPPAS